MTNTLNPAVSTIIPTFRRPRELEDAVRSVLAQDVPVEVWVVDDSPERAAQKQIEELGDARVHYLAMPEASGGRPGLVRNQAIPRARGEVLHFLDDDDIVPRGFYQRGLAALTARPRVGAVYGRAAPFGLDEGQLAQEHHYFSVAARRSRLCQRGGRMLFAAMQSFKSTMLVCSAGLMRRACVEAIGGFDPEVRLVEDVDLYARLFQRFEAAFLDETTVHYRIGPSLMHSRQGDEVIARSYEHMHRRYRRELGAARFFALKLFARTALRRA